MTLKLYYDLISPSSRTVYIFLKTINLPFEQKEINMMKGDHLTNDYKDVSNLQKVPILDDNGFKLMESTAIMRYIALKENIPDHWYPKDSITQAKVDEYLAWQHHNTNFLCHIYYELKYLKPLISGIPCNPEKIEPFENRLIDCMDKLETIWLNKSTYLTGDKISIADLSCISDLEQTKIAGYDPKHGRPLLSAWMERVKRSVGHHYNEVMKKVLNK